jgi:hypothetical protein
VIGVFLRIAQLKLTLTQYFLKTNLGIKGIRKKELTMDEQISQELQELLNSYSLLSFPNMRILVNLLGENNLQMSSDVVNAMISIRPIILTEFIHSLVDMNTVNRSSFLLLMKLY